MIFLISYLWPVFMRRAIRVQLPFLPSLQPLENHFLWPHDPSLLGIFRLSGNAQLKTPLRVKGGHTANYSHMAIAPEVAAA